MKVKITFKSELYIQGNTLKEIKNQWEYLPLFSSDALDDHGATFVEITSVEDTENNGSLTKEFNMI